jgi:hypothetical protein
MPNLEDLYIVPTDEELAQERELDDCMGGVGGNLRCR